MAAKLEARRLRGPLCKLVLGDDLPSRTGAGVSQRNDVPLDCLVDEALLSSAACAAFMHEGYELNLCPGRASTERQKALLYSYKGICDQLLPYMRAGGHLFNILFREKGTLTFVLQHRATRRTVGGVTFRIMKTGRGAVIADALVLAIEQQAATAGHGHGTCLINALKHLTVTLQVCVHMHTQVCTCVRA